MSVLHDIRFALRLLWKDCWFTAAAAAALALGIGVNTTVFTFVNAVLLRGLPFHDPEQIVFVTTRHLERDDDIRTSLLDLQDWRAAATAFEGLEGWYDGTMNISEAGRLPERVRGTWVGAGTFRMLGQAPLLGRDFAPGESEPGAPPVVILGYAVWRDRYGRDPSIVGRAIRVNEVPATVIGVMPEGMKFPTNAAMWQALQPRDGDEKRDRRELMAFGRLRPGISMAQARAELETLAARLARQHPDTNRQIGAGVMSFNQRFNGGPIRLLFLALMGAVGFVLLIACANVANLLLARSVARAREVAVRVALGAGRARIVRQLLVESVLLSLLGGLAGLGLALAGIRVFDAAVANVGKPYWIVFSIDWRVTAFLAAISVGTGLVFGLAPALQVSATNVNEVLNEGGRGQSGGVRARRFTSAMVVVQLALTLVLLTGAGLMVNSFFQMYRLDLGIETSHLMSMRLQLAERKYPTVESRRRFYDQLDLELSRAPGVATAAVVSNPPLAGANRHELEIEGRPLAPGTRRPSTASVLVGDRYFDVIDRRVRGRVFDARDGLPGAETVIVNERFAARFFPGEDPLGRRIRLRDDDNHSVPWLTIVGVSPTVQQADVREGDPLPLIYRPHRQVAPSYAVIFARSVGDPAGMAAPLRRAVQAVDADLPVFDVQTYETFLAEARWPYRVFGSLFSIFAAIALCLSAIGLYAVMAYSVAQRRQEIGIRLALGATGWDVARHVLRAAMFQIAVGLTLGLAGAWGVSRLLSTVLVRASAADPVTYVSIVALLVVVAIVACLVPARRASRIDPLVALRSN